VSAQETLIQGRGRGKTCISSFVQFRIRNTSTGDLRVILFLDSLVLTDDEGDPLFAAIARPHAVDVGGITTVGKLGRSPPEAYLDKHKDLLTPLAAEASLTVQPRTDEAHLRTHDDCKSDEDLTYKHMHRPHSYTFSGKLGTVDLDDNAFVHQFSLQDVPLHVVEQ